MGGIQTKEAPDFESGIYVSPKLVSQLQGRPLRRKQPSEQGTSSLGTQTPSMEESVVKRMRQDQDLRQALEESKLAGELLLKTEGEELKRVNDFANELLRKEYRIPSTSTPCLSERENVTECYRNNLQDPLQCASLVDAYSRCADGARKSFVASQSSRLKNP